MRLVSEERKWRARPSGLLRGRHLVVLDVASTVLAFLLALALRFDAPSQLFDQYFRDYFWVAGVLVVARVGTFLALRLYQRVWRYASVEELVAVTAAVLGSTILGYGVVLVSLASIAPPLTFPRSIPIIDTVFALMLTGGWRFALRLGGVGRLGARHVGNADRALVVGSAPSALGVIRELRDPGSGLHPVGVLVDDLRKGQRFMGLEVLGSLKDLATVVQVHSIAVVLLALPSADGATLRRLVRMAEAAGARCLTVPSVAEVVAGRVTMDRLREIDVEDLLRRAPARIDLETVTASFAGKRILITGGGGSIGSELARQLLRFAPEELVLLGRGENSIFEAMQTLGASGPTRVMPVILDIREGDRLHALFRDIRPDVVFHAAAHKHVTFMELFPEEAVATNILGTLNVVQAASEVGAERLVLISSDKAVNPTSVMGVTKRASELIVLDAAQRTGKRFVSVRFGNVLSSRGSVVPIFKHQLEHGGPLTVTDAEAKRYFMTIPEAVQLVMQAAALAEPADLFVLDMGDPVRILDLANDLIDLHGLQRGADIEIRFTGLRPGEKLVEELLFPYERSEPTAHEAVRRIVHGTEPPPHLGSATEELRRLVALRQRAAIIERLRHLVPEYNPTEVHV